MSLLRYAIPLFFLFSVLAAQTINNEPYETALPPVKAAIKDISAGNQVAVRLRYDGAYGNYLRFYDERGIVVLLAFRRHRWDYSNNHFLKELHPGHQYEVIFRYEAQRVGFPAPHLSLEQALAIKEDSDNPRAIRLPETCVLGWMVSYRPASLDDLRF